jgi:hypothetical protein
MKIVIAIMMTLTLAILSGCHTSARGGSMVKNEGFRISAPTLDTSVKQGGVETVTISVLRDNLFKQNVKLHISAAKGIGVDPTSVTVKASDKPDVLLQIAAPKNAAIGEYPVVVRATPETGETTSVGFTVKVVAP